MKNFWGVLMHVFSDLKNFACGFMLRAVLLAGTTVLWFVFQVVFCITGFVALGQFLLSATVCDTVHSTFFVPPCLYWATLAPGVFSSECWLVRIVYRSHSQVLC